MFSFSFSPRRLLLDGLLGLLPLVFSSSALAAAYVPASDAQVLERLPFKATDPVANDLRQLRREVLQHPGQPQLAARLADAYYNLVAAEGDPRYLGYAQAVLKPWWSLAEPPTDIQLLRARLLQFSHDFPGAQADLGHILDREPDNVSARALRATIYIVQARYDLARRDCLSLQQGQAHAIGVACGAMVDGLTGQARPAMVRLQAELDANPTLPPESKLWLLLRLAELAQRSGQLEIAEQQFRLALKLGIADTFLLAAYADLLLDLKRAPEVRELLLESVRSDGLLLRLAFAERAMNLPIAAEREASLAARYAAAQLRGDKVHQQEEARFVLLVQKNPAKALKLAQENWTVQREPRDARIFLEAAIAMKQANAAAPVLEWLSNNAIEDPQLVSLARQLQGGAQ